MTINDRCWYKDVCDHTCTAGCVRYNTMLSLLQQSNIPQNRWDPMQLVAFNKDVQAFTELQSIKKDIVSFVARGENLYIYSDNCGNGKTSWSIKMMLAFFDKIWNKSGFSCKALFISIPTFLYKHKQNINRPDKEFENILDRLNDVPLVVWDDIGSTKLSEYDHQLLLNYVDDRINQGLSNIFTGNCNRRSCEDNIGMRLTSRIFGGISIELKEQDKRGVDIG